MSRCCNLGIVLASQRPTNRQIYLRKQRIGPETIYDLDFRVDFYLFTRPKSVTDA